jgi:3',5'-cyclic AMP phosphodiesterase CpdA
MKLVHISDIHINSDPILGSDPIDNFARCLAHVESRHMDADRIVITGDLTHHGLESSYVKLREMLAHSRLQGIQAPRLMIGNHDNRDTFRRVFPEAQTDKNGFVQWTEEAPEGLFVYMDTNQPGTHAGHYCEQRQQWLAGILDQARTEGQTVWLFMHHNPITVHVANADLIGILQQNELQSILRNNADIIGHVFFGHCHYTLSGSVGGVPFSAPRSTNHPCWPEFSGDPRVMAYGPLAPNYNVCFLGNGGTVVHSIDFLHEDDIIRLTAGEDGWIAESAAE